MDTTKRKGLFEKERLALTYDETCEALGIPYSTLTKLVHRREIPFVKIGQLVRFQPEKLAAWLEERSHDVSRS